MNPAYDVAVAGAGILGLAHAYHLARRGLRVVVFERHPRAQGASVRNFGMIWPIGQPSGPLYRLARRSRDLWLEVMQSSGLWHTRSGSLHLAYHDDEAQVLREFVARAVPEERPCELLTASQVADRFPAVRQAGLQAGLWSPGEVMVDPRQVIARLPQWLARTYGVEFAYDTPVLRYQTPHVVTARGGVDRPAPCHLHGGGLSRAGPRGVRPERVDPVQAPDDEIRSLRRPLSPGHDAGRRTDVAPLPRVR
ncbi:MAG: FAD-dependent oxidoreductase [Gemmataceae bacterium]|nr:FAD-dependent oxidoreductase [Gemmataceae bacterium]